MEEKVLIQSSHYNVKKISIIIAIIGIIISSIVLYADYSDFLGYHDCEDMYAYDYDCECNYFDSSYFDNDTKSICFIVTTSMLLLAIFFYLWSSKDSLTITDKRVYGKTSFGKRIDLPIDSISSVGTSLLKGIYVGTSSGRISFKLIKNQNDIHSIISKLLMERQQKESKNIVAENIISTSNADELKKFKDLLDSGIITQEEFDTKKKQLLGL